MTHLLVSVTSSEEALLAIESGADIIDLKDPAQGALGALPLPVVSEIVDAIAGRRPVSATIGDLPMTPALIHAKAAEMWETGVDYVKVGFFEDGDNRECIAALAPLAARGIKIIAVLFADRGADTELVAELASAGFHGVMLDTASKDGRRLPDHMPPGALQRFVRSAQRAGLLTGLAGSLAIDDIERLGSIRADYLGFRSGLCRNGRRNGSLDRDRLKNASNVLHICNRPVWTNA